MIRLAVPSIDQDDLQAVMEVLASGYLVQGARVAAFERSISDYVGMKYAVAVSNGTAALQLALLSIGVCPGDLVVVPAYSWISTANVIELCGARPVFIDICADTFNMDPAILEKTLSNLMARTDMANRVKAIMPVHTFGQLAHMPKIMAIADHYGLPVIEDAACALGATVQKRQAGTWGSMGCFSFHPRKAITTGEGGIITTNDPNFTRRLQALRNHGQDPNSPTTDFIMAGFNYRMTEFQAALGLSQMTRLDKLIAVRRRLASKYDSLLADTPFQIPFVSPDSQSVYQSYVVCLPEDIVRERDNLIMYLRERGIETTIGTWNMPMTKYFRTKYAYDAAEFPNTKEVFDRSLSLPMYETLSEEDQEKVVKALLFFLENNM